MAKNIFIWNPVGVYYNFFQFNMKFNSSPPHDSYNIIYAFVEANFQIL